MTKEAMRILLTNDDGIDAEGMECVERIARVDDQTLQYSATLHDPKTWTRDWTVSLPLTQHPEYQMFEYACHEGNYAMRHILSGERATERSMAGDRPFVPKP